MAKDISNAKELKRSEIEKRLNANPKKNIDLFKETIPEKQAYMLIRLQKKSKSYLINNISDDEIVTILNYLDPDQATDLIQLLPNRHQKKILAKLNEELKKIIDMLILFPPDVAAGLMKTNYILVDSKETLEEVSKKFRNHESRTGKLPEILVMDEGSFLGYLPVHILGMSLPTEKVGDFYKKALKVSSLTKGNEIIKLFKKNPHRKIIVMGEQGNVLGIIYSDDVLQLIDDNEESLYSFAGVNNEETVLDGFEKKVNYRYKWLMINLATSFLAAFSVSLFEETISKYVLLAIYMPIIAGMGGNSATQTLAVLVRGLSQKQVTAGNIFRIMKNEAFAALINGFINGLIVAIIVMIFNKDVKFALVLAIAMIFNLLVAGVFGSLIPFIMYKLGKDPASSATIFITTATDVLGFISFLGLAKLILG